MREEFLPYCRPVVDDDDVAAVTQTLRSGWLTSGPHVREFEAAFAFACGVPHAVALNSCTAAMHLAMRAFDIGPGDEVVTSALTFVAVAQCVRHLGATPVFCDVDPATLCATAETIRPKLSARTKLIVTMPYAGRPCGVEDIVKLAKPLGIRVLEDAALAAGGLDRGAWAGTVSDAAAYSFYATKNISTGEGGMLVTRDEDLAERVRVLGLHGMSRDAWKRYEHGGRWRYDVVVEGFKYNMPDTAAALGLSQLRKLERLQRRRDEIAAVYDEALGAVDGVRPAASMLQAGDRHSYCIYPIFVEEAAAGISRDAFIDALREENIGTSVHYIPIHMFTAYKRDAQLLPITESTWQQLVSLPLYPSMNERDVNDVIQAIRRVVRRST